MRSLALAPLLGLAAACSGKPPLPDAGLDAGLDAGFDAGPECLDPDAGSPADAGPPSDAGAPSDAGTGDGGDFSCAGRPRPTSAVRDLAIDGFVTAAGLTRNPVPGALVELFDATGTRLDFDVSSSTDGGRYAVEATLDCLPLDGALRASKPDAGFYDAWYYPPEPWRRPRADLELVIFDDFARNLAAGVAQVTIMNGTGALALGLDDCRSRPVSQATLTTNPMGEVRYVADNGLPSATLTQTSSRGQALIFNLPPGDVTVSATARGQSFSKTIRVRADAITTTTLVP